MRAIAALCAEVDKTTKAQIAVVTVQTLAGSSIEDDALHPFNEWEIVHEKDNRACSFLFH
jgi:uncharacterized membrane protein YgcG